MILLLLACTWGVEKDPLAGMRAAERERAAAATGAEVCETVRRCQQLEAQKPPENASLDEQMAYDGEANMMAPQCEAYRAEAESRGYPCRWLGDKVDRGL